MANRGRVIIIPLALIVVSYVAGDMLGRANLRQTVRQCFYDPGDAKDTYRCLQKLRIFPP